MNVNTCNSSDVVFKEYNTIDELKSWVADTAKQYEASIDGKPTKKVAHLMFNIITDDQQQVVRDSEHG